MSEKIPSLVDLTCREVVELVTDYMHGELSLMDRVHFEQHLHACTWCMTYLEQMRSTQQLTAALQEPEAPVEREALLELYRSWQRKEP